jgi:4-oxalocrotonate tautomerase
MPIINLKVSKNLTSTDLQEVVAEITKITTKFLKKKPEVTAITVQMIPKNSWFVNSKSLEELNQNSFYLDIKVTDGTNLKDEKADYIEAIFKYMNTVLDNLHTESYVYVEEIKGDSYGFGGKTQEFRYIDNKKTNL